MTIINAATITRTGSVTNPLNVAYTLSGTATNGVDYTLLSGTVTILAGNSSANIAIEGYADSLVEGTETIVLTLAPSATYNLGTSTATINLLDAPLPGQLLIGTIANEALTGGGGNDTIYGGGNTYNPLDETEGDTLTGGAGNDIIRTGTPSNPTLSGGLSYMYGGAGNDTIYGGIGSNYIYGSDGGSLAEIDILVGAGYNTDNVFVLGSNDGLTTYYAVAGSSDYAVIEHFTGGTNTLQLAGNQSQYSITAEAGNTNYYLLYKGAELIAKIHSLTPLSNAILDPNNGIAFYT